MRIAAACERVMRVLKARLGTCCCSRDGGSSESASISSFEIAVYGGELEESCKHHCVVVDRGPEGF